MKAEAVSFDINGLHTMLESMSKVLMDFSENAMVLFHSSTTQIDSDEDLEKRIELMDTLMDMAEKEDDIAMVYAHTISDRIAEYEENIEMPKIPAIEMLKGLMDIKNLKQKDLSHIAPQSVISEILKGKREINLKQAKGFAEYFNIPIERFINWEKHLKQLIKILKFNISSTPTQSLEIKFELKSLHVWRFFYGRIIGITLNSQETLQKRLL